MAEKFAEGMLVELPPKPELGAGKILKITGNKIYVFFKNQETPNAMRFLADNNMLIQSSTQNDQILNHLPPFVEEPGGILTLPGKPKRWTLQQALDAFHKKCPLGFNDPRFLELERNYKWQAHEKFEETLGGGRGKKLLEEGNIAELVQRVLAVTSKVNLLSPYENMALHDAMHDEFAAKKLFTALFAVLDAPDVSESTYLPYIESVLNLPQEANKARVGTWPIVTLLPFIAQPERHMFLKPTNSNAAAESLAFNLKYQAQPNWKTYEALLTMGNEYFKLIKHLGPRDFIDVQSFIWVVTA